MTRLPVIQPKRACGDCTACCTSVAVDELSKPRDTECQHEAERGCGIYDTRPKGCRHFNCAWVLGYYGLTGSQRPDRFGVVVYAALARVDGVDMPAIHLAEAWDGAHSELGPRLLVRQLMRRNVPLVVLRKNGQDELIREVRL